MTTISPRDRWRPFRPDVDPAERLARTRSLRAIVALITGLRGIVLADRLREAETDTTALVPVLNALDALTPLGCRRIVASYAALR